MARVGVVGQSLARTAAGLRSADGLLHVRERVVLVQTGRGEK